MLVLLKLGAEEITREISKPWCDMLQTRRDGGRSSASALRLAPGDILVGKVTPA